MAPLVFKYKSASSAFSCKLQCVRCCAKKTNGQRCTKTTCIGTPMCWIHLLSTKKLRIKSSPIPGAGKGLFAQSRRDNPNAVIFARGAPIVAYGGETLTQHELNARYGKNDTAPYAYQLDGTRNVAYENAACQRGVASLANHASGSRANAELHTRGRKAFIRAKKNIMNGDEILLDYGDQYRFSDHEHLTKRRAFV